MRLLPSLCLGAGLLLLPPLALHAQDAAKPAAATELVFTDLGRAASDGGGVTTHYTLQASQPLTSRLTSQKVRFIIEQRDASGRNTRQFDINTGKHKTARQLVETLSGIFNRYTDEKLVPNGQDLGKIGDLSHGGEMHFIAESATTFRMDIQTQGAEPSARKITHADAVVFAGLLRAAK